MTRLRIFDGTEVSSRFTSIGQNSEPDVIPFAARTRNRFVADTPLTRAKALHKNRRCCYCGHGTVDPVTLSDGLRDASGQYIPGTATLVGFHCTCCHAEWPIYAE